MVKFSPEIVETILARIADGQPLRAICRDENMPNYSTFYDWVNADKDLAQRFARAREIGQDVLSEQCLEIADDERHDWVLSQKGEVTNEVAIGRAKLQIWTRMQLLAKWNPKKYGDKVTQEHTGADGSALIPPSLTFVAVRSKKDEQD
jgi:SLT domain-containing protein